MCKLPRSAAWYKLAIAAEDEEALEPCLDMLRTQVGGHAFDLHARGRHVWAACTWQTCMEEAYTNGAWTDRSKGSV